ncbi:MAG: NPCBM/NEW2 domain-containing protein [Oscillospiraceae bacterium]|nr:NPCBM/NEW2 domain-containing protein [Oscillospiraceae bacterium]
MAKFCTKCGKALPKGSETCPECSAFLAREGAALFTQISHETESWKDTSAEEKKEKRIKKIKNNKLYILICIAAVIFAVGVGFLIYYTSASSALVRTIQSGDYEAAREKFISSFNPDDHFSGIDNAILEAGKKILADYRSGEITRAEADAAFSSLYGFGSFSGAILSDVYGEYIAEATSKDNMERADALFAEGKYLEAYDIYVSFNESDAEYEEAMEKAPGCFPAFGISVCEKADKLIAEENYVAAMQTLSEGNLALAAYDTFSSDIDNKIIDTKEKYEEYILSSAEKMGENEEYKEAMDFISSCIEESGFSTDSLTEAIEDYRIKNRDKTIRDYYAQAVELYENEEYENAFLKLDELSELLEDESAESEDEREELLSRFTEDMIKKADETLDGRRDNLESAIECVEAAVSVVETEGLSEKLAELKSYLPEYLTEYPYTDKTGVVFRNASDFTDVFGKIFKKGWLWGRNDSEIVFDVDSKFDVLDAVFTIRRDDEEETSARFEIFGDGRSLFSSEELKHDAEEAVPVYLDISGIKTLTIHFYSDYETSTAEGGYCYHGLCDVCLKKLMPGEFFASQAEEAVAETEAGPVA